MERRTFCLVAALFISTGAYTVAAPAAEAQKLIPESWQWRPVITVPRLPTPPTLDGKLDAAEWEYATRVDLLVDSVTGMQPLQASGFCFGYSGSDVYFGFHHQRPKGSGAPKILVTKKGWSATPLWVKNDNVEIWLAPFTEGVKPTGMMAPAYCVALNAAGAYSHSMSGWVQAKIPRLVEYAPRLEDGLWTGEVKIPFALVAKVAATPAKLPPGAGVEWTGSVFFQNLTPALSQLAPQPAIYAFVHFRFADKPIGFRVSALELGAPGKVRFTAAVHNGSDTDAEYELSYEVFRRQTPPRSRGEQFLSYWHWIKRIREVGIEKAGAERGGVLLTKSEAQILADLNQKYAWVAGGSRSLRAAAGRQAVAVVGLDAPEGYYVLGYRITEKATGKIVMQQVTPALLVAMPLQVRPEFLLKRKIVVRVGTARIKGVSPGDQLKVTLIDKDRQVLAEKTVAIDLSRAEMTVIVPTDKTREDAAYTVTATVSRRADGQELASKSQVVRRPKTPEWFGGKLGLTDKVAPGFAPLEKTAKGFKLGLRQYIFAGAALPQMIESRGEALLAGPITLKAQVNGQEVKFKRAALAFANVKPTSADFTQQWRGSGLTLAFKGRLEYDGLVKYDIDVSGNGVRLEKLTLEIPVKEEYCEWFSHQKLGTKVAGTPARAAFPYGNLERFFKMYPDGWMPFSWALYLGRWDRGIEWVAESDRTWSSQSEARMMGLVKSPGRVTMVIRLVDKPVTLTAPRRFTFGIFATPIRDISFNDYFQQTRTNGASLSTRTPLRPEQEPKTQQRYQDLNKLGFKILSHYTNFGPELFSNVRFYAEKHLSRIRGAHGLARKHGIISLHYCGYSLPPGIPENETFGNEMRMEPPYRNWYNHASPFSDYWLHGAKFMIENAQVSGFHTDGLCQVKLMTNPTYGFGWQRDGQRHGTYPVFAARELFKRFYQMIKFEIKGGFVAHHMPHVDGPPVFTIESFSDMGVSGEQFYSQIATIGDLPLDQYRMIYGFAQGVQRTAIWSYKGDMPITKNMMLTLYNLHGTQYAYINVRYNNHPYEVMGGFRPEIEMWQRLGRDKLEFLPYWQHPDLAEVFSDVDGLTLPAGRIKVSAYLRRDLGRAILIVANLDQVGYMLKLKPNLKALGLTGMEFRYNDPILGRHSYRRVAGWLRFDIYPQRWRAILMIAIKPR